MRACAVDGCDREWHAGDWCSRHYRRWKVYGDPTVCKYTTRLPGQSDEDYFWMRVQVGGPDECWPWIAAARTIEGYGRLGWKGRQTTAPRVALELSGRPVAAGEYACHHCDNPPCVNPSHLFPAGQGANINDMWTKGRGRARNSTGTASPTAVLSDEKVRQIRAEFAAGATQASLVRRYGVAKATMWRVVTRRSWQHVD